MTKESTKPSQKDSQKGTIGVDTKDIFPIIKQWLYSERDIFVRELVSNSFDAITKRKRLDKQSGEDHQHIISITLDEKKKTFSISDTGLGMSQSDIEKYINQIASSGAEDFLKKFKKSEEKSEIIGHFGLGFYSSFMVADLVSIESKSFNSNEPAVTWLGRQDTSFEIKTSSKKDVGTTITLHLNDDSLDYAKEDYVTNLIKKYANFLPIKINVNTKECNDQNPLWIKNSLDLKKEDYTQFYSKLFPFSQEPLFWIHLNVDYPFRLQGILYFPQVMHELDSSKGRVQLYCQQVFVTENVKEILPEFLTLLQGAIDCPEIPLNVSRSQLQNDPYVQKISKHIVKKVADKLVELSKKDKKNYESYWKNIHPFIKYGMMNDDSFYDKTKEICLFKSAKGLYTTIPEYLEANKEKLNKQVIYASNPDNQSTYINLLKKEGLDVILFESAIDTHFIQFLESKDNETKYVSVDSQGVDFLLNQTEEKITEKTNEKEEKDFIEAFKKTINQDQLELKLQPLMNDDLPALLSEDEMSKRFREMNQFMGPQGGNIPNLPRQNTLILNKKSPIIQALMNFYKLSPISEKARLISEQVYDLALLSQEPLTGDSMADFIARSNKMMTLLAKP